MSVTPVKDTQAMISGMAPVLDADLYHFCMGAEELLPLALASFREDEGLSLILSDAIAASHGLRSAVPMRRITLTVHSALDGVGLTAAVSSALATAGIACNMVAATHHDHAFVTAADAARAMIVLEALAAGSK